MPHAYAFVDPLFSTGIAWGLRAVERLALAFEHAADGDRKPDAATLARYDAALSAEGDQIDLVVAGAYEAMAHFDLFAAQAMLYFATVSFAEVSQRLGGGDDVAWKGFLGVGDPVLGPVPRESLDRLRRITGGNGATGIGRRSRGVRRTGSNARSRRATWPDWRTPRARTSIRSTSTCWSSGMRCSGMSREALISRLPALRGLGPEPTFAAPRGACPVTA